MAQVCLHPNSVAGVLIWIGTEFVVIRLLGTGLFTGSGAAHESI